jgi:hypothetical protein
MNDKYITDVQSGIFKGEYNPIYQKSDAITVKFLGDYLKAKSNGNINSFINDYGIKSKNGDYYLDCFLEVKSLDCKNNIEKLGGQLSNSISSYMLLGEIPLKNIEEIILLDCVKTFGIGSSVQKQSVDNSNKNKQNISKFIPIAIGLVVVLGVIIYIKKAK